VLRRPLTDGVLTASGRATDTLARVTDQRSWRAANPSKAAGFLTRSTFRGTVT